MEVVFVDDEAITTLLFKKVIANKLPEYFSSIAFTDPEKALEHIEKSDKDIILITDHIMPRMKGIELISRVKNKIKKAILTTGMTFSDEEKEDLKSIKILMKPLDEKELLECIH